MSNLAKVVEWAVWANLDNEKNTELILLKGHMALEIALDSLLYSAGVKEYKRLSFYSKVKLLSSITKSNKAVNLEVIQTQLLDINKIRNQLAHEWTFKVNESELEEWSSNVRSIIKVEVFSNLTHRTKIVHAFSSLAKEIVDLYSPPSKA